MIKDTSQQDIAINSSSSIKRRFIVALAALVLLALILSLFFNANSADKSVKRASIQVATIEVGDLLRDIVANGRVVAANAPQVYSPEQGFVSLKVRAGDYVEYGQVIAELESPELENRLEQERSEMDRLEGELSRQTLDARSQSLQLTKVLDLAKVDLEAAERENRRAKASITNNLISQIDFEKALDDLARAQVNYKHAEQEVEIAKDKLAFELESAKSTVSKQALVLEELERKTKELSILATVNGVVGNLLVQARTLVEKNDPLMTLVDLSAYEVELNVAESNANDLGVGMPVEITVGGEKVMGNVSAISPEVNNRQVIARVRFEQDSLENIRQNQQVSGRVLLENKSNVLKVRRGSFMQAGGFIAYKLENGIARKTQIQVGATSMREVEILSGLQPDDQIIISNYDEFIDAHSILIN